MNKVIVALNKDYTYFNGPINHNFEDMNIVRTELLLHPRNSNNNEIGDIILIYLKSNDMQSMVHAIGKLNNSPYVVYAEPDYLMEMDYVPNDQYFNNLWGLQKVDMYNAWEKFTGCGKVVVGIVDSGIYYNHPDIKDNMRSNPNDYNPTNGWDFYHDYYDPSDQTGHGTHVAGIVGGVGNNCIGVTGVNWNVKMSSLKIAGNSDGVCSSAAIKAILYAIESGIPILNNSWGGRNYCRSLKAAIEEYNGLFIASAGNTGTDNDTYPHYPASYDCNNIISVAATTPRDQLASFSCYGATTVDVAAPGTDIYSLLLNGRYGYKSGTSMAAPYVAGAAALLKGFIPDLTALEMKDIILSSVDKFPQLYGKILTGGRINVNTILETAKNFK